MSTRCTIRNLLLASGALAIAIWPSLSNATEIASASVLSWGANATPTGPGGVYIATTQYPTAASWDAGAAAASVSPGAFSPNGLTFTAGLNLTNTDLIIQADNSTDALAAYNFYYQAAKTGYNGGAWTGSGGGGPSNSTGLYSDSTNFNTNTTVFPSGATDGFALTGIGVILNDLNTNNFFGNDTGYTSFDGIAVGPNSILAKYTYYGDTGFNGTVTQNDVFNAETGRDFGGVGWANGETTYSGSVTQNDVFNVETGRDFSGGDPIVFTSNPSVSAFSGGAVSVPEPATAVMGLLGALGLIGAFAMQRRRVSVDS